MSHARQILFHLPHDLRRSIYRRLNRFAYSHLEQMRAGTGPSWSNLTEYEKKRCLFFKVPKTGGQSVAAALFNNLHGSHTLAEHFALAYSRKEWDSFFKFCFVRNPWDRLLSSFRFLKAGGISDYDAQFARNALSGYSSFEEFVKNGLTPSILHAHVHFVPQYEFVCLPGKRLVADFVGYYEQLNADFDVVAKRLGMGHVKLPHINKTAGPSVRYQEQFTPEMIEKVGRVYADDVRMFQYRFDGYEPINVGRGAESSARAIPGKAELAKT